MTMVRGITILFSKAKGKVKVVASFVEKHSWQDGDQTTSFRIMYSETSLNRPDPGPKNRFRGLAGFVRLPKCKELFGRDLRNQPIFREGQFSGGLV